MPGQDCWKKPRGSCARCGSRIPGLRQWQRFWTASSACAVDLQRLLTRAALIGAATVWGAILLQTGPDRDERRPIEGMLVGRVFANAERRGPQGGCVAHPVLPVPVECDHELAGAV